MRGRACVSVQLRSLLVFFGEMLIRHVFTHELGESHKHRCLKHDIVAAAFAASHPWQCTGATKCLQLPCTGAAPAPGGVAVTCVLVGRVPSHDQSGASIKLVCPVLGFDGGQPG